MLCCYSFHYSHSHITQASTFTIELVVFIPANIKLMRCDTMLCYVLLCIRSDMCRAKTHTNNHKKRLNYCIKFIGFTFETNEYECACVSVHKLKGVFVFMCVVRNDIALGIYTNAITVARYSCCCCHCRCQCYGWCKIQKKSTKTTTNSFIVVLCDSVWLVFSKIEYIFNCNCDML